MKLLLDITCTYSVEYTFDDVPDDIAQKILECGSIARDSEEGEWISDHVREKDAYDWEYDVLDAEELKDHKTEGDEE